LTQDLFHTGFDASWDIDLFGGVRRSIEAADLAASQEDLRGILVSLLAEVARNADLATGASHFWLIGPTLSWLIVDAGRIRANIAAQGAREEQQLSTSE
jgi:outer membrane protein TolC